MTEAENILHYFESRRELLNLHRIEQMAGVPQNTLVYFLNRKRGLPCHHEDAIVRILSILGYEPSADVNPKDSGALTTSHQFL